MPAKFKRDPFCKVPKRLQRIFNHSNRDTLLQTQGLHEGRGYVEPRLYEHKSRGLTINYIFTTRIWHEKMDEWLRTYKQNHQGKGLDLIIINSCLWDVNR